MINFLAENNFGDTRSGGLAGPTGLVIILLLIIATVFLVRNMSKRLRRLPESFDSPATGMPPAGPRGPAVVEARAAESGDTAAV